MRRETVEQILAAREIEAKEGRFDIPADEVATILIGADKILAVGGVVSLTLDPAFLFAETKKGASTYVEYEDIRGLTFEPKAVADRHAGFF